MNLGSIQKLTVAVVSDLKRGGLQVIDEDNGKGMINVACGTRESI